MPITHLTDFSDRLSPMLVKELRQGLRAKTFIAVFLSLQVFLAVMMFSATAASTSDSTGGVVSGIIFGFFSVAVLLVQPLRGIGALSSEMKSNTLDMMALTRLSSWRIVLGKWVAIVSQTALLLSTIVPYLILRYFFGGMNLVGEMVLLALIFLTSIFLTAFTVGLSGCTSVIIRALLPVFGLPIVLWMMLMSFAFRMFGGSPIDTLSLSDPTTRFAILAYILCIWYVGYSMLSLGASLIAPAAENHSILRRLIALTAMLVTIPLCYFNVIEAGWHVLIVFVIAVPAIIIALTESAPLVSTVCKPFLKKGTAGELIGLLFYPVWSSGVFFSVLLGMLGANALFLHPEALSNIDASTAILAFLGSLFFPAVWQILLFRGDGQRLTNFLLILVGSYVMLGILYSLAEAMNNESFLWFFAWNPLVFVIFAGEGDAPESSYLMGIIIVNLLIMLALIIRAILLYRKAISALREADESLQTR